MENTKTLKDILKLDVPTETPLKFITYRGSIKNIGYITKVQQEDGSFEIYLFEK